MIDSECSVSQVTDPVTCGAQAGSPSAIQLHPDVSDFSDSPTDVFGEL